jgi:hypothetical protein
VRGSFGGIWTAKYRFAYCTTSRRSPFTLACTMWFRGIFSGQTFGPIEATEDLFTKIDLAKDYAVSCLQKSLRIRNQSRVVFALAQHMAVFEMHSPEWDTTTTRGQASNRTI